MSFFTKRKQTKIEIVARPEGKMEYSSWPAVSTKRRSYVPEFFTLTVFLKVFSMVGS